MGYSFRGLYTRDVLLYSGGVTTNVGPTVSDYRQHLLYPGVGCQQDSRKRSVRVDESSGIRIHPGSCDDLASEEIRVNCVVAGFISNPYFKETTGKRHSIAQSKIATGTSGKPSRGRRCRLFLCQRYVTRRDRTGARC